MSPMNYLLLVTQAPLLLCMIASIAFGPNVDQLTAIYVGGAVIFAVIGAVVRRVSRAQ